MSHLTWQVLHPAERGGFLSAPAPPPLARLRDVPRDGGASAVYFLPPAPGGAGEPVLLGLGLGLGVDSARLGGRGGLASALANAGFSVYWLGQSGHRGGATVNFDALVERDVPAAVRQVLAHSGYPRLQWIGHGLGALLGLAWAGRHAGEGLASMSCLGADVRPVKSARRALVGGVAEWVGEPLPLDALGRAVSPLVGARHASALSGGAPNAVRSLLYGGLEPVPCALAGQVGRWHRDGLWARADGTGAYLADLERVQAPLWVAQAAGDSTCGQAAGSALLEAWGGGERELLQLGPEAGHLDLLLGEIAEREVVPPLVRWIAQWRRSCWEDADGGARRVC
ncbi:MAG: hypothetical protein JXX28_18505 [Deltaproteobacteria bacterium]|nr:hypothetical protein [Deltaproteobacteria bacterium]